MVVSGAAGTGGSAGGGGGIRRGGSGIYGRRSCRSSGELNQGTKYHIIIIKVQSLVSL